jgi:SAM-dependent methyltransferase
MLCHELLSYVRVELANRYLPVKHKCPCCGWEGNRFHDYFEVVRTHTNVECPQCASHPRHRALFLWMHAENKLANWRGIGLVFAPEAAFASAWASAHRLHVFGIDVRARRNINLQADLCNLPVANNSIDLQWCHHVLEHIKNDRDAIKELYRILRPVSGELILSVPMRTGVRTLEYGFSNTRESGHWRVYGDDFVDTVGACGFHIEPLTYDLSPQDRELYGLIQERYYICTKPE